MNHLAKVLTTCWRPQEAIDILEKIVPIVRRTLGDAHPGMSMTKANLTQAYVRAGRWGETNSAQGYIGSYPKRPPEQDRCHTRVCLRANKNETHR